MGFFRKREQYDEDMYDYAAVEEVVNAPLYVEDELQYAEPSSASATSQTRMVSDVIAPWDLQVDQSSVDFSQTQNQTITRPQNSGMVMDILPSY